MFGDIVPDNGTNFVIDMCHVALDANTGVNIGLHKYGGSYDEVDTNIDLNNEDSNDDDMPDLHARNHKDIDSSGDEVEGNPTRTPIARKNTVIFKDDVDILDDKYHKVTGVND